jgi:hypothetical protein
MQMIQAGTRPERPPGSGGLSVAAIALCSGAQADSSWRCGDARVSPPSHVTAYIRQVYDDLDMKRVAAGLPTSQVTYWERMTS